MYSDEVSNGHDVQSMAQRIIRGVAVVLTPALIGLAISAVHFILNDQFALSPYAIFAMFPGTLLACVWLQRPDKRRTRGTLALVGYGITFPIWGYLAGLTLLWISPPLRLVLGLDASKAISENMIVMSVGIGGSLVSTVLIGLWTCSLRIVGAMILVTAITGVLTLPAFYIGQSPPRFEADSWMISIGAWHLLTAIALACWGVWGTPQFPITRDMFR